MRLPVRLFHTNTLLTCLQGVGEENKIKMKIGQVDNGKHCIAYEYVCMYKMYKNAGITFSLHHQSAIEVSSVKYSIIFTLSKTVIAVTNQLRRNAVKQKRSRHR